MIIRNALIAVLMCLSMSAAADFRTIELAYEVPLVDFSVPVTSSASLTFRECATCETMRVRMTRSTSFIVNGENIGLKEFRKSVNRIRNRETVFVIVKRHLESDTITSLSVTI